MRPALQASIPSVSSIMSAISSPALSCLSASNLANIPTAASMVTLNANSASLLLTPALSMASVMPASPLVPASTPAAAMSPTEDKASRKTPPSGRETPSGGTGRKSATRSSRSSLDPMTLDKKLTVEEKKLLEEDRAKAKAGIHVYRAIPPSEKKTRPTKRCALCLQDACRRESRYFCLTCEKGFHVRCFIEDHLRLLKEKKDVLVEVRDDNFNLKENGAIEDVAKIVNARVPVERAANNSRPLRRSQNGVSVAQLTMPTATPLAPSSEPSPNVTPPVVTAPADCMTDSSEEENNTPPGNTIELVVRGAPPIKEEPRCAPTDAAAIKTMLLPAKAGATAHLTVVQAN